MEHRRSSPPRVLFFLFLILVALLSSSAALPDDAAALLAFKRTSVQLDPHNALADWTLSGGRAPPPPPPLRPCSWTGVTCSPDGRVAGLTLRGLGLVGRLDVDSLLALPGLRDLDLQGNYFYGNLSHAATPATLCGLQNVDLSSNNFTEPMAGGFLAICPELLTLNLSRNFIPGGGFPFAPSIRQLDLSRNRISDSGLLANALTNCRALIHIDFSSNKLAGGLRSAIACPNLAVLDLSGNLFSGVIPTGFMLGMPVSLKQLALSHNNFSGDFSKVDFGGCGNLTSLDISSNALAGAALPVSLSNCRALASLDLSGNQLAGVVPPFLSNLAALQRLSLANNRFSGIIPPELGLLCPTMRELNLSGNALTGALPDSFASCSALQRLDLGTNALSGDFVTAVVSTMPSLLHLRLAFNNISGPVPLLALRNCTFLEVVDLSSNQFTGPIAPGFCPLPSLQKLLLANNYLTGILPSELAKCVNLRVIDLSLNELEGKIPSEIFALPQLAGLVMWGNNFSGTISDNLCSQGASLNRLILNHNALSGIIPPSITRCSSLIWVSLSGNRLTGTIPEAIGDLESLAFLQLGNNSLSGPIPPSIGRCRNLVWIDATLNNLSGPIPPSLAAQSGLIAPAVTADWQFAFLRNEGGTQCAGAGVIFEFNGIRPERLEMFPLVHACPSTRIYTGVMTYPFASNGTMIYMDLSYNSLSGTIPKEFGIMAYLQVLNLGHNQLNGSIPTTFGGLKSMGVLDVSHNHLTGSIPGELGTLSFLNDLDVSNNNLSGPIPTGGQLMTFPASKYENNSADLCGGPLPACGLKDRGGDSSAVSADEKAQRRRLIGGSVVVGIIISALILIVLSVVLFKAKREKRAGEKRVGFIESLPTSGTVTWKLSSALEPLSINVATFEKPLKRLTFAHLLEATNGFSAETLIGSGGFGEVYRAKLKDGSTVAIKKLVRIANQGDREFTAEMETIGKVKHRNLVPLLGYCKVGDERLLVYEYMVHGSLETVLHDQKGSIITSMKGSFAGALGWAARKKVAIGAARGLAFLHHSCIPHIIHRDMKSSNVLLDENLEARVSDFGMARLMNAVDTHLSVSTLAGTPGYVPPEYYQSFRCTTKGDVYSYGVVLLELLSGKRPIDTVEFGDNNLVGWAKQLIKENRSPEIFDPELTRAALPGVEAELRQYLKIACNCLEDRPLRRPTMIQVMSMFKDLQHDDTTDVDTDETDDDTDALNGFSMGGSSVDESKENV